MDNQYKFIEQPVFPKKKIEEVRKVIDTQWDEISILSINDLGFLLQKNQGVQKPTWWLENEELFLTLIGISYSVHFLDEHQAVISLRRGDDILIDINEVKSLIKSRDFIDHLYTKIKPLSHGYPRRILTFINVGVKGGENKLAFSSGTLIGADVANSNELRFDDYLVAEEGSEERFYAKTEVKEPFSRMVAVLSEVVYPATVRNLGSVIDKFHALEELNNQVVFDEYKDKWIASEMLVERTPTVCYAHELTYYNNQIVDSFVTRIVGGHPEKCTCDNPNCGTIHVEHGPVDVFDLTASRFIVLNKSNGQTVASGVTLQ